MNKQALDKLRELLSDDDVSEDEVWEWCLERGGYIEVLADLVQGPWDREAEREALGEGGEVAAEACRLGVPYFVGDLHRVPVARRDGVVWYVGVPPGFSKPAMAAMPLAEFGDWLRTAKHVDSLVFVGGEPKVWEGL